MAAVGGEDNGASDGGECHDLKSILAGDERDFLIHNNGDQVKIANLEGKTVGLYFSASWCPPCRGFTPKLIETYGELSSEGKDFEVVFVSGDRDEDSFNGYFSKMPWLAIPFSDSKARDRLHELFKVRVIPHLVILGARGEVLNEKGVPAVREYGSEGYPFTPEKINKLKEDEEAAKREQTLQTVLVSPSRDFLISNDGNKVKIANLEGKTIGLYFSASWCPPCRRFTPQLIETYGELSSEGKGLEVVFVSGDRDEDSFNGYFSKMPWLAIPFSDSKARDRLNKLFKVRGIPHLVILDARGEVVNEEGVEAVGDYGSGAYPFTLEKINKLKEDEEAAKRKQTLQTVLVSPSRDYLISNNGNKVSVSELEGKIVCLYFTVNGFDPCDEFTVVLAKIYRTLKERGESFEVVLVSLDDEESSFKEGFASMPWLAIPFEDKSRERLVRYFELETAPPTLVVLGPDGKTMHTNIAELVEEHGEEAWEGFPFSQDKLDLLAEKAKAKLEAQTLESLLVSGETDYVIGKDGVKVPVSELIGKNILLYFSAKWCGPCRAFLPKLIEEYNKIKEKDSAFEVVFISSDRDQNSFEDFFSGMPWLALPFGDERKKSLNRVFKIRGIPSLVAIGPTGKTVTTDARHLLMIHGADAYPFTEERIKELVENKEKTGEEQEETKEGYVCDGDVCRKA